jgi:hypothetical protein
LIKFDSGPRASPLLGFLGVTVAVWLLLGGFAFEAEAFDPNSSNPVVLENQKPGNADWGLTNPATGREIEGYASLTSVNRGGQIALLVNTTNSAYRVDVFRMGWYGGAGARRVYGPLTMAGSPQTIPPPDPVNGLVECNWTNPCVLNIPATRSDPTDWAAGVYLARLTGCQDDKQSYIIFVVRDDARSSGLLVQLSFATYAAYNPWGGKSLYNAFSSPNPVYSTNGYYWNRATKVSFNRPFAEQPWAGAAIWIGAGEFFGNDDQPGYECNLVRWLEREGYDVSYCTSVDTHATTNLIWNHKAFLSMGHDEYWSYPMRWNVKAARDRGIGVGFIGSNDCYRQVRFEPSTVDGAANRNVVCYKSDLATLDPLYNTPSNYLTAVEFRDYPVLDIESSLLGVSYDLVGDDGDMIVSDPTHWIFAGTGVSSGQRLPGLLGGEADSTNAASPGNISVPFVSPYNWSDTFNPIPVLHYCDAATYVASSGATVFASGSMHWTWGLDDLNAPFLRQSWINPLAQQITRNILARLMNARAPSPNFFFRTDAGTLGNWKPVYGIEGFAMPGNATNLASTATLSISGASEAVYALASTDPNALRRSDSTTRGIGGWSSPTNFVLDLNLTDGRNHQVALHCWDWNQAGRTQQIDLVDAATGTVIDRQILTAFTNGQWLAWQANGHVQLRVTNLAGSDCLVSALMLGSGSGAKFVTEDAVTQGAWKGWYGSDALWTMADWLTQPPYGTLLEIFNSNSLTNWVFFGPDPRAFQAARSTNQLLAAVVGDCFFTLNLTDNAWHQLALYCVDAEALNRYQVVSLFDMANNAMLDSRPITNFAGGKYLTWNIRGNVRIQIQSLCPAPAVLSAIFLDPPNQPPAVSLSSPVESQRFFLPTNIVIHANTTDADGSISQVSFYADTVCLGTVTNPPFTLVWTNALVGQYHLTAVAVDDRRANVVSTPVAISVAQSSSYQPPFVQVMEPANGMIFQAPTNLVFAASCNASSAPIVSVQFLLDGAPLGPTVASAPYSILSGYLNAGLHAVSVVVTDSFGLTSTSSRSRFTVLPAWASASFRDFDEDDQGSWGGLCGSDGYVIAGVGTNLPAYALATPPASDYFVWVSTASNPLGLQLPSSTNRLLSAWYTYTNSVLDVNLLDGNPHRVTLYMVDGSGQGGSETVQLSDPTTGQIMDSRTVTNLSDGAYLVWDLIGHVQFQFSRSHASSLRLLSGVFFDPARGSPGVAILSPTNGTSYALPTNVVVAAQASFGPAAVSRLELLVNGAVIEALTPGPQNNFIWTNPAPGTYTLSARAVDITGAATLSDPISITIEPTSASATFATTDTTDQGSWLGRFGRQGSWVAGDSTNPPPYLSLAMGSPLIQWATNTTDPRALWRASGGSRVAAAWQNYTNLVLDVKCSDATFHRLTLYCVDWYNLRGSQWVDVLDNVSGALLDHRVLPPFGNGVGLSWYVKGHLRFCVRRPGGSPAFLSGIFLDASPTLPAISITSPKPGSVYAMPANVSVTANAAPDSNNVSRVDFYDGTTLLGSASNGPPFTYTWMNAPAGSHSLRASEIGPAAFTNSATTLITVLAPTNISIFGSALQPDGTLLLNVFGPLGRTARLEAATNLAPNAKWIPLVTNTAVDYLFNVILGDPTNCPRRFYRLVLLP